MTARRRVLIVVNDAAFFLSHRLPIATFARDAGFDNGLARRGASRRVAWAASRFARVSW